MSRSNLYQIELDTTLHKDFANRFGVTYFAGQQHYRITAPNHATYHSAFGMPFNQTHSEEGVACEMTRANMDYMIRLVNESLLHHRARERNPAAAAAYQEYLTLYHLTLALDRAQP